MLKQAMLAVATREFRRTLFWRRRASVTAAAALGPYTRSKIAKGTKD